MKLFSVIETAVSNPQTGLNLAEQLENPATIDEWNKQKAKSHYLNSLFLETYAAQPLWTKQSMWRLIHIASTV